MKNLLDTFCEDIKHSLKLNLGNNTYLTQIYSHLFETLRYSKSKFLDYCYSEWLKEDDKEKWFYDFHKSIRQTDMFSGFNINIKLDTTLTEEESIRYGEVRSLIVEAKKELENYEWNSDEYILAKARIYVENRALNNEFNELKYKSNITESESIGGHLDMVLWNLIQIDNKNVLFDLLNNFFEDVKVGFIKTR